MPEATCAVEVLLELGARVDPCLSLADSRGISELQALIRTVIRFGCPSVDFPASGLGGLKTGEVPPPLDLYDVVPRKFPTRVAPTGEGGERVSE
eukprot:GHVU01192852.1.p2 GENE.GHVU01192852.1~~GHVU01192852.1.p2  ORF type:complete len:106 (-),score=14.18 GHVU01192852.1:35-316(-)